jgi:hypothetical protein
MTASALPTQDRSGDRDLPNGLVRPRRSRPVTVSISSLRDHGNCPTSWALRRLDRAVRPPEVQADSAVVGSNVHRVLELMADGENLDTALAHALDEAPNAEALAAQIAAVVDTAAAWGPTDPARPTLKGSEVRLRRTIDGIDVAGVADAIELDTVGLDVDAEWSVSDYKTGDAPDPVGTDEAGQPIWDAGVTRQPVLYAELAESPDRHFRRARVLYPKSRSKIEVDLDTPRGKVLRIEARRWVAWNTSQLHRSIAKGFFAAKPSPSRCAGCPFAAAGCPASAAPTADRSSSRAA